MTPTDVNGPIKVPRFAVETAPKIKDVADITPQVAYRPIGVGGILDDEPRTSR